MNIKKNDRLRRNAVFIGVFSIIFLFLSSATAIPQVNGSITVNNIERQSQTEAITSLLMDEIELFNQESDEIKAQTVYIFASLVELIIINLKDETSNFDVNSLASLKESIEINDVDEKEILLKTQDCIDLLSAYTEERLVDEDISNNEKQYYLQLNEYLTKMQSICSDEVILDEYQPQELLQQLFIVLLVILIVPLLIFTGLFAAGAALAIGLLKCVFVVIKVLIVILIGLQSFLTISAISILLIGVLCKISISIFSRIASPIVGLIASRLTTLFGKIFGNSVLILSSIIAVLLVLAIPLVIVAAVVIISQYLPDEDDEENDDETTIFGKIMTVIFRTFLNIEGSETFLHRLWIWLGNHIQALPDWPFES